GSDVQQLADAILQRTCHRLKAPTMVFSEEASQSIADYSWPGNVRELENAIERAVVLAKSSEIGGDLLAIDMDSQPEIQRAGSQAPAQPQSVEPVDELSLEDYFQRFVLEHQDTLNETQLAGKLGISRKCLWERRQRFGIPRKKKRAG
ncbi:MAG: sigma-54-dependent Fis family transcriptional regulator, partial [Pseudomonadota bacterium]|nr:sigma-54-dependent Fis family transcriptional regulator [Pseudomonadota bacterium]